MIGHFTDQAKVMGNEQHGHSASLAQFSQQHHDLTLYSDIQRCGGFVCNQQLWLTSQGHGNHDALLLSA